MIVSLCDNWQDKILSIKARVYPLDLESNKLVDDIFNEFVVPDSYLLPIQADIIANVQGCTNLVVLNTVFFLTNGVSIIIINTYS